MVADPLSDVLALVRPRCLVGGRLAAGGRWALRFPPPRVVKFTVVTAGGCRLAVDGIDHPVDLGPGDVFMVSAGRCFVLGSDLTVAPGDGEAAFERASGGSVTIGGGAEFAAIGVHVSLQADSAALLVDVLPPLLHVGGGSPDSAGIGVVLGLLAAEVGSDRPAAGFAARQLAGLLFAHLLRALIADDGEPGTGWLGALRDPAIAPALRLMHRQPERPWRVAELAREAGMSRTAFALRFKSAAGVAPLAYLGGWRMHVARRALRDGMSVAGAARSVGYDSESAFSAAFRRATGMAPGRYRGGSPTSGPSGE